MCDLKYILLAEDEVDIRVTLELLLQEQGYHVCAAADGMEVMKVIMRGAKKGAFPSLILIDGHMPQMGGFEFSILREGTRPEIRDVPMYIITGESIIPEGIPVPIIKKPINLDYLFEVVARHVPRCDMKHKSSK